MRCTWVLPSGPSGLSKSAATEVAAQWQRHFGNHKLQWLVFVKGFLIHLKGLNALIAL